MLKLFHNLQRLYLPMEALRTLFLRLSFVLIEVANYNEMRMKNETIVL